MKVFILLLVVSATSFAQTDSIDIGPVSIKIAGQGNYVCMAEAMSVDRPVLARAATKTEAELLAKEECGKINDKFFCKPSDCEKDSISKNVLDVVFDVKKDKSRVEISYKGDVKYLCKLTAWNTDYWAKAPTKLEARVLASNACADGNKGDAFFCRIDDSKCELISGTEAEASVSILNDIFKGIYKKKPNVNTDDRFNIKDILGPIMTDDKAGARAE